jgi:hypothetical protein
VVVDDDCDLSPPDRPQRKLGKAVRIAEDVHSALARRAKRNRSSVQAELDAVARIGLLVDPARQTESARQARATTEARTLTTVKISGGRDQADEPCRHPVGRRIGTGCGACGKDPIR